MTLFVKQHQSHCLGKNFHSPNHSISRNTKTAQALKRYLDLTLVGSRKNVGHHQKTGRKEHPPSPYTFDRPELEASVNVALKCQPSKRGLSPAPEWISQINENVHKHNGESPLFTEKFLPLAKSEQPGNPSSQSRPLSGVSTKSAPVIIDGEMFYRPSRTHSYLQASNRPSSAKEGRLTRASDLRNKHRNQTMSAVPSNDTKLQLKRMRESKPKPLQLTKDLMPIPAHTGESPHSFIVGARYNCSHFMDSRSYNRLGLYVPREDPLRTFLKIYKGKESYVESDDASDFVGYTSVRPPGSSYKQFADQQFKRKQNKNQVKKVVKEAWLNNSQSTTKQQTNAVTPKPKQYKAPSTTPRSEKSTKSKKKFNIQGQQMISNPGSRLSSQSNHTESRSPQIEVKKKQSIEAIIPATE